MQLALTLKNIKSEDTMRTRKFKRSYGKSSRRKTHRISSYGSSRGGIRL